MWKNTWHRKKNAWLRVITLFLSAHERPLLDRSGMSRNPTQKLDAAFWSAFALISIFSRRMAVVYRLAIYATRKP
jgi:hypothetical protein